MGLAVQAHAKLTEQGRKVRVVSMPCTSVFDAQDAAYKQSVLPLEVGARIAIEAAHADFWYKYVGLEGRVIGMTTYGESAPASALFEEFGFTRRTFWVPLKSCWKTDVRICGRCRPDSRASPLPRWSCIPVGAGLPANATPQSRRLLTIDLFREYRMPHPRPYKVALNGYGRIGRCVLRALFERGADAGFGSSR